jgi:pimeloyl-ACP methyl ester carboxylesterase
LRSRATDLTELLVAREQLIERLQFLQAFAQNASADTLAILAATQRPIALPCIQQPSPEPAWKTKPSWRGRENALQLGRSLAADHRAGSGRGYHSGGRGCHGNLIAHRAVQVSAAGAAHSRGVREVTKVQPCKEALMTKIAYRTANVDGIKIFYRRAGPANAPTLLLLHGFPTSSHMFRDLIPLLADRFHIVAPDLPGFGQSDLPSRDAFSYTFARLAEVIGRFTEIVNLKRFAIYIFDYGAPVGLRIAIKHPERITAIISQNGNAYEEGLSDGWNPIQAYWREPTKANRDALRTFPAPETTVWQYTHGVSDPSVVSPDGYSLDNFYLARTGAHEAQLDLFLDYASNVALYPQFQAYFRNRQPPLLAIWGRNDPFFLPAGAEAYKRDIPAADVRFLDTGHFALETHHAEIATAIRDFIGRTAAAAA